MVRDACQAGSLEKLAGRYMKSIERSVKLLTCCLPSGRSNLTSLKEIQKLENLTVGNNDHPIHLGHSNSTELVNVSITGLLVVGGDISWQKARDLSCCSSPPKGSSTLFSNDSVSPTRNVVDSPGRGN